MSICSPFLPCLKMQSENKRIEFEVGWVIIAWPEKQSITGCRRSITCLASRKAQNHNVCQAKAINENPLENQLMISNLHVVDSGKQLNQKPLESGRKWLDGMNRKKNILKEENHLLSHEIPTKCYSWPWITLEKETFWSVTVFLAGLCLQHIADHLPYFPLWPEPHSSLLGSAMVAICLHCNPPITRCTAVVTICTGHQPCKAHFLCSAALNQDSETVPYILQLDQILMTADTQDVKGQTENLCRYTTNQRQGL